MIPVLDTLMWSFTFHYHRDKMNAAVHCAPVRFSELTFRLAEVSLAMWAEGEDITQELAEVRDARRQAF
jgi:hypothetical protein